MSVILRARDTVESFLFSPDSRADRPWYRAAPLSALRVLYLAMLKYQLDGVSFKAYALTFITALAIVPMAALSFSIAKGFGVANTLRDALYNNLTGVRPEILDKIYEYVSNTNVKTLGTMGLVFIVYTVIKTVGSMETAFNQIWNVSEHRSFIRKSSDYISVMVIFPLLLLATTGLTASLSSTALVEALLRLKFLGAVIRSLLSLGSYFTVWVAFFMVYKFLPNTNVPVKSALIGSVVGGTLWNIVQMIYIAFQIGVSKYNAIYGTFATLPLFLIWLNLSWMIVLFGAEISWVTATKSNPAKLRGTRALNPESVEDLAVAIMLLIGNRFIGKEPPYSPSALANTIDTDVSLVENVLEHLENNSLLSKLAGDEAAYQPARALSLITLQDIVRSAHGLEHIERKNWENALQEREKEILNRTRETAASELSRTTLLDLIAGDRNAYATQGD